MALTIQPIRRALVPVDSASAQRVSAPNYDEFQSDAEISQLLHEQPDCVLGITMPHCQAAAGKPLVEGTPEALAVATARMAALAASPLIRTVENVLWVYEIVDPKRPGVRQIGLGAMARIGEIRGPDNPRGTIIRNEGVREKKARGRADLIRATSSFIGVVNNAVDDHSGQILQALQGYSDERECDFSAHDHHGNRHLVWLVTEPADQRRFQELFSSEPCAYVADGNHRSAAAAMLGSGEFLAVFFPAGTMGLAPYNRLIDVAPKPEPELLADLASCFEVESLASSSPFQPLETHQIGLYTAGKWYRLVPRPDCYDPGDAVQDIDAEIVQRNLFGPLFGVIDPTDERFNFVGGDREAAYLQQRVDEGAYGYAVTLPPVTMQQFIAVCQQNRIMPPKSTWFEPKVRSGLVIALID